MRKDEDMKGQDFCHTIRSQIWKHLSSIDDNSLNMIYHSSVLADIHDKNRLGLRSPRLSSSVEKYPRVLLLNAPWRTDNRFGVRAGSRWPFTMTSGGKLVPHYVPFPFYLAYAAAVLEQEQIVTGLIDAIAEGLVMEDFLERVFAFAPDLVVLETSTPTIHLDLEVAWDIRFNLPDCKIALCGPHATVFHESLLTENTDIDFIVRGEYEHTLRDLALALRDSHRLEPIDGLTWRNSNKSIISNGKSTIINDLDALPWPAWQHLPMYNYNDDFRTLPIPNVQLWASRGCPYRCSFCAWPQMMYGGRKYRVRKPEDVAKEMACLVTEYGFKGIYFDDDTFNIGKERILQLCHEIKRLGLNVPWAVMARADTTDEETLKAMADSGMVGIKFGVESATQSIVDDCGKNLDLTKVDTIVAACKKLGVKVHLTFTFGLPGETKETVQKTIDYALKLDPDSAQFSLTTPFPGTRLFDEAAKEDRLLTDDWRQYDGNQYTVMAAENLSRQDLETALSEALQTWEQHLIKRTTSITEETVEANIAVDLDDRESLRISLKQFYTDYKQYYVTNAYYQMARQSTDYPFYDYLSKVVTPNMDILDVGSSSGVLTMEISRLAKSAKGVDISPAAQAFSTALRDIEYQRHKLIEQTLNKDFQSENIKQVEYFAASAEALPFPDASFDLIYSTDTFEHIVAPENALREIARCLKSDGHIVLQIIKPDAIDVNLSISQWEDNFIAMPDRDAVSQVDVHDFVAWCDELNLSFNMLEHGSAQIFAHLRKANSV